LKVQRGTQTYELICKGLAADPTAVCDLYEEMVAAEVEVSERVYAAVMRALAAREMHDRVCDLYEKQMAATENFRTDGPLRGLVLDAATKAGRTKLVEALSAESAADLEEQVSAIKTCGLDRNLQGAKRVFDNLKKSGAPVNSLVYNCLIDSCVQCGDAQAALEYFEQMKQLNLVDVVSYNTVLRAHLSLQRFEDARALLREMSARGLPANRVTYNDFLRALVAARDRRAMWALVDDMTASGVAPDGTTCSILLKSLTQHSHSSDVSRTMAFLRQMQEPIDEVLFSAASEACIRVGRLDQLSAFLQMLKEQSVRLALTAPCYGSMIKAYGNDGDVTACGSSGAR
jgi:pentatricopeptide repeat protein